MKKIAIIASIGLTFVAAGTLTAGLISSNRNNGFDSSVRAVNFSSETITRRVYFVNNDNYGYWYADWNMHVEATSLDGTESDASGLATRIYDSYWKGLYYADVSFAGIGSSIKVKIVSDGQGGGETKQVTLPALSDKAADVVWINNNNDPYVSNAPVAANEAKCVLDHISTCDPSYASGYNAYPQLIANFNMQNISGMEYQSIGDVDKEGHDGYNAAQKVDELETQYNEKGW